MPFMSVVLPESKPARLASIDVYRGIVMFLIGVRLLELDEVAQHFPGSAVWQFLGFHSAHVPWVGCSLNDLIHPSFAFLTGAALVFSVSSRVAKGQPMRSMVGHALWRSLVLILLGIFLRSQGRPMTNWTFEETLTQTGLAYMPVFALAFCTPRTRWVWFGIILVSHWLLYVCWPLMPPHADPEAFNIPAGWSKDFSGLFAHWNLNRNVGWSADLWLLNQFPRPRPYVGYLGGYATLNFIPTIATMILGLMAGTWLRQGTSIMRRLLIAGVVCIAVGLALHFGGVCPLLKRLWTPAWVFFSGGCCCLILAALYYVIDVRQWRRWAFLFVVIGMNSLAFYVLRHTLDLWLAEALQRHLGESLFLIAGAELKPVLVGASSLAILCAVVLWMHRRKIFLRV